MTLTSMVATSCHDFHPQIVDVIGGVTAARNGNVEFFGWRGLVALFIVAPILRLALGIESSTV
jgi:hypothetical protein